MRVMFNELGISALFDFGAFSRSSYSQMMVMLNDQMQTVAMVLSAFLLLSFWLTLTQKPIRIGVHYRLQPLYLMLSAAFLTSGYYFFHIAYSGTLAMGSFFTWAFLAQAALALGVSGRRVDQAKGLYRSVATLLVLFGVIGYAVMTGHTYHTWKGPEFFALMPDPTIVVSCGVCLLLRARWWMYVVPLLWAIYTGLTQQALEFSLFWLLPSIMSFTLILAYLQRRHH